MKKFIIILILFLWVGCTQKSEYYFKPKYSVSLNSEVGKTLVKQYSRDNIEDVEGFWIVTVDDVELIENNFKKVNSLKANYSKLQSLDNYAFQYVGLIIRGEKFIYINAFPAPFAEKNTTYDKDWTKQPIKFYDGGNGFWGVLFNPKKEEFSKLSING